MREKTEALEAAGPDPRAALELGTEVRRRLFPGHSAGLVDDRTTRAQLCSQWDDEIIHDRLVGDWREQLPANGVNRAVGAEERVQAPLAALEEGLVLPVKTVHIL